MAKHPIYSISPAMVNGAQSSVIFSQLYAMPRRQSAKAVSISSSIRVAVANIFLYIYTRKYGGLQLIMVLPAAATLSLYSVFLAIHFRRRGI